MKLIGLYGGAALVLSATLAYAQAPAAPATAATPIERIKAGDGELSCAQLHGESEEMGKIAADAKAAEDKGRGTAATAGAANTAAEVAGRTGLFGAVGGIAGALFGQAATQTAAGAVQQTSSRTAQDANERTRQAQARKEHLSALFVARDCKVADLSQPGRTLSADELAKLMTVAAPQPAAGAAPAAAIEIPDLAPQDFMATLDAQVIEELRKHRRVVVGGFRVAFVTKAVAADSIRASYRGGGTHSSGVNTKFEMSLRNVDLPRMQALVERAYQEFMARLKESGVEIIPHETFAAHPAYNEISFASKGDGPAYTVDNGGRSHVVLSPAGMKLWFGQAEPLGDQGAFGWGNGRKAGVFAFENKAVVINPLLVVDFAETSSGRNKGLFGFRNSTDVEVKSGISLRAGPGMTHLAFVARSAPIEAAIAGGAVPLKEPVMFSGDFGKLETREQSSNRGLVVGLGLLGLSGGPVRETQKSDLMAEPAQYEALAGAALLSGSRLIARTFGAIYKP